MKRTVLGILALWGWASCSAESEGLHGRWTRINPGNPRFLELRPDGLLLLGDTPERMSTGRFTVIQGSRIRVEIPQGSSFPGEFQIWQVRVALNELTTYREGSFGLADATRHFRRVDSWR